MPPRRCGRRLAPGLPVDAADAQGNLALGNCRKRGMDAAEALQRYELAAAQEDADAQFQLGVCHERGIGVQKVDANKAASLFGLAADQGHADAQYKLGVCHATGIGVKVDAHEAARLYGLAAKQGHARAQCNLGVCHATGVGVQDSKVDADEAARLFRLAADQGHADAQCNLGVCHRRGAGVKVDAHEAARLYGLAAKQGHSGAQFNLGTCYELGIGVHKVDALKLRGLSNRRAHPVGSTDANEAVRLYRLAADQGHAGAQFSLGTCYEQGTGVEVDYDEAVRLYSLSAAQGHADAQYNLGVCHELGAGVLSSVQLVNTAKAVRLYDLAADQDHAQARRRLAMLRNQDVAAAATDYTLKSLAEPFSETRAPAGCKPANGASSGSGRERTTLALEHGDAVVALFDVGPVWPLTREAEHWALYDKEHDVFIEYTGTRTRGSRLSAPQIKGGLQWATGRGSFATVQTRSVEHFFRDWRGRVHKVVWTDPTFEQRRCGAPTQAWKMLGKKPRYNLTPKFDDEAGGINCESFVRYCYDGHWRSTQAERFSGKPEGGAGCVVM